MAVCLPDVSNLLDLPIPLTDPGTEYLSYLRNELGTVVRHFLQYFSTGLP